MSETKDYEKVGKAVTITASAEKVWEAITRRDSLQCWVADNVIFEAAVGGRFAAWGPGTSGNDILPANAGKITAFDPGKSWTVELVLMGFLARFTLSIEEAPGGCRVSAQYELPQNRASLPWFLSQDHAIVALGNLRCFVETGEPCVWPGPPDRDRSAHVSVTIQAPASDVFASLTVPEVMNKWLSSDAKVDLRVGGQYDYGWTETGPDGSQIPAGPVEILELESGTRLRHSWRYSSESPTQVEWIVQSSKGSTKVRLTHSGFGEADDVNSYVQGWAAFLVLMKALLEGKSTVEGL